MAKPALKNSRVLRMVLLALGLLSTLLAVLGIFLPLLPTVPFLLLAASCFARSSDAFHRWLLEHPRLGPVVRAYQGGAGVPRRAKITSIALIWMSIPVSAFLVPLTWVRIFLFAIGLAVTAYLLRLPTAPAEKTTQ